jgi:hypothetical protein
LVHAKDFINEEYNDQMDREILDSLYSAKKWLSADEIIGILSSTLTDAEDRSRTIRRHLKSLVKDGVIEQHIREATGRQGRAPEIYALCNTLRTRIDHHLNVKETRRVVIAERTVPGLLDKNGSTLSAKVVYHTEFAETKGKKKCISVGWTIPPASENPWLLKAMLTAQQLGDLPPSDAGIKKLKKDLMVQ